MQFRNAVTYRLSTLNSISERIIGAAIEVHRELGPGLLESVYEICLVDELKDRSLAVEVRKNLPVVYKGKVLDKELVADIMVENAVILELKVVEHVLPVHQAQLLSYLRLTGRPLGLLLNFQVDIMARGLTRIVNDRVDVVQDAPPLSSRKRPPV